MRAKRQFAQTAATRLPAGDPFETKDLIVPSRARKVLGAPANRGERRRPVFVEISLLSRRNREKEIVSNDGQSALNVRAIDTDVLKRCIRTKRHLER